MTRAIESGWSVEESVTRLKRFHYVLRRLAEILTARITAEPIYELKLAYSHHAYLFCEHANAIRKRVGEMREPPLGLDAIPHEGLQAACDALESCECSRSMLLAVYSLWVPRLLASVQQTIEATHPLADAPTVRTLRWLAFELKDVEKFGEDAIAAANRPELLDQLLEPEQRANESMADQWLAYISQCLDAAGDIDGSQPRVPMPDRKNGSMGERRSSNEPKRDRRFQDKYNAGVNPEAFLYDEQYSPRAKTLMVFYKRLRELDVPEMMATILKDLRNEEPWEFHYEMTRQLWDEARHAMMGEVGFVSLGLDWTKIPINFTWSRNLNLQLDARQRHGVLFFIEQGLMPKNGKRFEWEVTLASGDPLAGLFQDFDWADEVLHAQIGRRWYVPRYGSLNEALGYGDACWSKVLSHWHAYQEQGLTEHRNWWPELYLEACRRWGVPPNDSELSFSVTYEDRRADLKKLDS